MTNDTLADEAIVIVSRATPERDFFEPGGAAVFAYESGNRTLEQGADDKELLDETGAKWQLTEEALLGPKGSA